MRVALMQPYFFPYLGYFQLINSVDEFVIFDNAQHVRRSWISRNRILNEHKESVFINVPISKSPRETKIKDILINNNINWQEKLFDQLIYYKQAPYFNYVLDFLNDCLSNSNHNNLSEFNTILLRKTCSLLCIKTDITILSKKFPAIESANSADEWGIKVSKALNATTYINAIGGKDFYNQEKYRDNGISIYFIKPSLSPYKQFGKQFIPGLSIIDVMMFNDINKIKDMLEMEVLFQ
ncbi:WbqC family protein [Lysinibacillus sp. NPDC093688]|uniref:WbqC family protein n=1 Tax=Lysinibacillus sp. NPDC093688 TaxID=3390577 RepID=UPI003D05C06F